MSAPPVENETTSTGVAVTGLPVGYEGSTSLAVNLARAEVDQQIMTAKTFPRSIDQAVKRILTLATLDAESAEECVYALPRGGKPIKGPSVRLAEIIASQWGNARVGARVVHVDRFEKYVEAEGVFHDLETNMATTSRVRRRISDKHGRILTDDMIIVTGNAAMSIAKRNAILGAVPKAVWRKAYQAVEQVIAGDVATLSERKEKAFKAFAAFGVKPEQIVEALGVGGPDDIAVEHMSTLMGMHSALKSGESTVEEMFPAKPKPGERPKNLSDALDKLAQKPAATPPHDPATGEVMEHAADAAHDAPANGPAVSPKGAEGVAPHQGRQKVGGDAQHAPAQASPSTDDDAPFPGDEPSARPNERAAKAPEVDPREEAYRRGQKARRDGLNRRALPGEYRDDDGLAMAWQDGFESEGSA